MVQYLEVPKTPAPHFGTATGYNLPSYNASKTQTFINGFYSNSARNAQDNLSTYTRRSNSDYALTWICQPSSCTLPTPVTTSGRAFTPPSYKRTLGRLSTPGVANLHTVSQQINSSSETLLYPSAKIDITSDGFLLDKIRKSKFLHIFCAEFLGTAILMIVGCSSSGQNMNWTFAIGTLLAIHVVGPISEGHLNPGATIVAFMMRKIQFKLVPFYWIAQFLGAIIGYSINNALISAGHTFNKKCITKPEMGVDSKKVFGIEFLMSFIFFMAFASLMDPKNKYTRDTASLKFGLIIFGLITTLHNVTLSTNTVRSFAPAVITGDFDGQWIYWVGPNLGAVLAGFVYCLCFNKRSYAKIDNDKGLS